MGCSSLTSITIPEGVTSIGNNAFDGCSSLTNITIPESVTSIGFNPFKGTAWLNNQPDGVVYLDNWLITYKGTMPECSSIEIKEGTKGIVGQAFLGCSSLTDITIPKGVISIGPGGFFYCNNLSNLTIPEGVTSIEDYTFSNCSSLTNITIPKSVTNIGYSAFSHCSSLTNITIPNVTSIGREAFYNCSSLTNITIQNVTSIRRETFYNCRSLTNITIPEGVRSIGSEAFDGCRSLHIVVNFSNLSISKASSSFGYVAYYAEKVFNANSLVAIGDFLFETSNGTHSLVCYAGNESNVVLPNNFNGENYSIEYYAFYGHTNIQSLTIGSGVLSIEGQVQPTKVIWLTNTPPSGYTRVNGKINYVANGQYTSLSNVKVYPYLSSMFEANGVKYIPVNPSERTCDVIDCTYEIDIENVSINQTVSYKGIPMTVEKLMPYAFHENNFIKELTINNKGVVGYRAFQNCQSLQSASISNDGNIEERAFENCKNLETILAQNGGAVYTSAFENCTNLQSVSVSNEGPIGNRAFLNCINLQDVKLEEGITSIGEGAFYECASLKEINIPNSVTTLGKQSFQGCVAMDNIKIGNGTQSIEYGTFYLCRSLPEIIVPKSVTKIGDYAFLECTALKNVIIEDRDSTLALGSNVSNPLFSSCPLDSVYIGGDLSYNTSSRYGYSPFYRNATLRTVVITDKEDEIYDNEFYGCTGLKNVTIGDGVKKIGNWAFSGCSSLDYFAFGKNVESIGEEAFSDCVNVTQIISSAATPPTCGTQALDDINKWNCTLKVPMESLAEYQQAEQWKDFFFIEGTETGIGNISSNRPSDGKCDVYGADGRLIRRNANVRSLKKGLYIINGKKVLVK